MNHGSKQHEIFNVLMTDSTSYFFLLYSFILSWISLLRVVSPSFELEFHYGDGLTVVSNRMQSYILLLKEYISVKSEMDF